MSYIVEIFKNLIATPSNYPNKKNFKERLLAPALSIFTKSSLSETPIQRLTEQEQADFVQKYSKLQTPGQSFIGHLDFFLPLLAQIHADALISKTDLEALPSSEAAEAWLAALKQVQ